MSSNDIRARLAQQGQGLTQLANRAAEQRAAPTVRVVQKSLDQLIFDERIQVRVGGLDEEKVQQYVTILENGGKFPPIDVFQDDDRLYVSDGFHRGEAHRRAGVEIIDCIIRPGTFEEAMAHSETANLEHGLGLTKDDKKNILRRRIERGEWNTDDSNRMIAKSLGVTHPTIQAWRKELSDGTGKFLPLGKTTRASDGRIFETDRIKKTNQKRAKKGPTANQLKRQIVQKLREVSRDLEQIEAGEYADKFDEWIDYLCSEWGIK